MIKPKTKLVKIQYLCNQTTDNYQYYDRKTGIYN